MPKRSRERSIDFKVVDGLVFIEYEMKKYVWHPPKNLLLDAFLNEDTYEYSIVHNPQGVHCLTVEDLRKNVDILCQAVEKI
jgi:hypothetical protein